MFFFFSGSNCNFFSCCITTMNKFSLILSDMAYMNLFINIIILEDMIVTIVI